MSNNIANETKSDDIEYLDLTKLNRAKNPISQLDDLIKQREKWENSAFKQSNTQLYQILGTCIDIYYDIEGMTDGKIKQRRALNEKLDSLKIKYTESTKLITKIIRYVFKTDRKRSYVYSRVCEEAIKSKIDGLALPKWIEKQGGIEEVRKVKKGTSDLDTIKNKIYQSSEYLKSAPALTKPIATVDDLQPSKEGNYNFCAALVRTNANGTSDIVFSTVSQTVIKSLLVQAAQKFKDKLDNPNQREGEIKRKAKRQLAVAQAA